MSLTHISVKKSNLFQPIPVKPNEELVFKTVTLSIISVIFEGTIAAWIVRDKSLAGDCDIDELPGAYIAYDKARCIPELMPTIRFYAIVLAKKWRGEKIEIIA